jgi:hypothetical protein
MVNGPALKWLERMETLLRSRKPRIIGVRVDGNKPIDEDANRGFVEAFRRAARRPGRHGEEIW